MSRFDPDAGLVQDMLLEPTSATYSETNNPELYNSSHEGGGNLMQVQGAGGWEDDEFFVNGPYLGKVPVTGLKRAKSYIFTKPAVDY